MELAAPFALSQPAVSKHLRVLENAGLITKGRDGQRRPCKIEMAPLNAANDWIERYQQIWEQNYARLDDLLETLKQEKSRSKRKKK